MSHVYRGRPGADGGLDRFQDSSSGLGGSGSSSRPTGRIATTVVVSHHSAGPVGSMSSSTDPDVDPQPFAYLYTELATALAVVLVQG